MLINQAMQERMQAHGSSVGRSRSRDAPEVPTHRSSASRELHSHWDGPQQRRSSLPAIPKHSEHPGSGGLDGATYSGAGPRSAEASLRSASPGLAARAGSSERGALPLISQPINPASLVTPRTALRIRVVAPASSREAGDAAPAERSIAASGPNSQERPPLPGPTSVDTTVSLPAHMPMALEPREQGTFEDAARNAPSFQPAPGSDAPRSGPPPDSTTSAQPPAAAAAAAAAAATVPPPSGLAPILTPAPAHSVSYRPGSPRALPDMAPGPFGAAPSDAAPRDAARATPVADVSSVPSASAPVPVPQVTIPALYKSHTFAAYQLSHGTQILSLIIVACCHAQCHAPPASALGRRRM